MYYSSVVYDNLDYLTYRYNGFTNDKKFNEFDNAFILLDEKRHGKISLTDAKNDQEEFNSNLREIKKKIRIIDQKIKNTLNILKCFTKQGTKLLNF